MASNAKAAFAPTSINSPLRNVLLNMILPGENFQQLPGMLHRVAEFVRVSCAEDYIDDIGDLRENPAESIQYVFAKAGRRSAAPPELILEISWIDETHIVNAIRDQVDLCRRCTINALQHLPSAFGHNHQPDR